MSWRLRAMNYARKIEKSSVLFSCCSGYNFYFPVNRRPCEVFGKSKNIIQHIKTEEYFYITEFPEDLNTDLELNYWIELIRKPADLKHYIWPVDVISLSEHLNVVKYALVFPIRALPIFETITTLLSNDMQMGWELPWVKKFAANLLDAWCQFDSSKYAYHEFSVDNMFYQHENYNVMFDFSFSTQKVEGLYSTRYVNKNRVTPDYADSYFYLENRKSLMDLASDYYSIAVILFKLLVGRLPYQGKVMEHEPNANELEHNNWMEVYHKNTYFIFDERDDTNHIGGDTGFAKDELFVERWNGLPDHVKNMFHNVFQTANVLRSADELIFYSPHEWRDALFGVGKDIKIVYRDNTFNQAASPNCQKERERIIPEQETADLASQGKKLSETVSINLTEVAPEFDGSEERIEKLCEFIGILKQRQRQKMQGFHDVILLKIPQSQKIVAIKVVREITGLSLAAIMELVDNTPAPIAQGISETLAKKIQAELTVVHVETKLSANTKHNDQIENEIVSRMQGHWQGKV